MKKTMAVALIFLLAFAVRLIFIYSAPVGIESDEAEYDRLATNILEHKGYISPEGLPTSHRPPLYPAILAAIYGIFGHSHSAVRIIQALVSALTTCLFYLIAHKIYNNKSAIIAGIFSSLYMPFVFYSKFLLSETFFSFVLALIVFIMVSLNERAGFLEFSVLGILCGVAALFKSTGLLLPLLVMALLMFKKARYPLFVLIISFAVIVLPWTFRNYIVHKRVVPVSTNGGLNMYQAVRPLDGKLFEFGPRDEVAKKASQIKNEADKSSFFAASALKAYMDEPLAAARTLVMRILFFFNVIDWNCTDGNIINYQYIFIMPFFMIGLAWSISGRKDIGAMLFVIAYFTALVFVFQGTPRFRMPIDGYFIIIGSYGIYELVARAGRKAIALSVIIAYLFFAYILYLYSLQTKLLIKSLMERAGLW